MAECEFEEKEYEAALYNQLATGTTHLWTPGQVLENQVGIDAALLCSDPSFWGLQGVGAPLPGVILAHLAYPLLSVSRPLPNFSLNLFLQAKRPQPLARLPKTLKDLGMASPYWRFKITSHQQDRLENLAKVLGPDAIVCYAAPAFSRLTQLYAHTIGSTIVANSTFPRANMLHSHSAWNYSGPGVAGVANARPVRFDEPTLEQQIAALRAARANRLTEDSALSIARLAGAVQESANRRELFEDPRAALFNLRASRIDAVFQRLGQPIIRDYLKVFNYTSAFNMLWLSVG